MRLASGAWTCPFLTSERVGAVCCAAHAHVNWAARDFGTVCPPPKWVEPATRCLISCDARIWCAHWLSRRPPPGAPSSRSSSPYTACGRSVHESRGRSGGGSGRDRMGKGRGGDVAQSYWIRQTSFALLLAICAHNPPPWCASIAGCLTSQPHSRGCFLPRVHTRV